MEVSGQLHTPGDLLPGKVLAIPVGYEALFTQYVYSSVLSSGTIFGHFISMGLLPASVCLVNCLIDSVYPVCQHVFFFHHSYSANGLNGLKILIITTSLLSSLLPSFWIGCSFYCKDFLIWCMCVQEN